MESQSKTQQKIQQKEKKVQELRTALETLKVSNVRSNEKRSGGQLDKLGRPTEPERTDCPQWTFLFAVSMGLVDKHFG